MATYRIGINSEFSLDAGVGIGTSTPRSGLGDLRVDGTIKTEHLDVTGVSTFIRYSGFSADNIPIHYDKSLTGEHSTQGDIVVGVNSTFTVSAGATVDVGAVPSVSIGTHFSPPTGGVEDRPENPVEGTVRFNTDVNTLEFYNGFEWRQFTVNGSSGLSGRGVFFGGYISPAHQKIVDYINIQSRGNSQDFGQLSASSRLSAGLGNNIRGINGGAFNPSYNDTIEYITFASKGNPVNFGNLTTNRMAIGAVASNTRGCFTGGYGPSPNPTTNVIDYVEIMTLGNAVDFGDSQHERYMPASCSSQTRGIIAAGQTDTTNLSHIDYITIASTGNAITFGDLVTSSYGYMSGASPTRGVFAGAETDKLFINYIEMATTGSAAYFGDLSIGYSNGANGTVSSHTRAIFAGGRNPSNVNYIESVEIMTTGNAVDFGDRTIAAQQYGGCSDSHGGLGGI